MSSAALTEYPITSEVPVVKFDKEADSRALVPGWATNRAGRRAAAKWFIKHHTRIAAYHAMRSPLYLAKVSAYSPLGAAKTIGFTASWIYDGDVKPTREEKAVDSVKYREDLKAYRKKRTQRLGTVVIPTMLSGGGLALVAPTEIQTVVSGLGILALGGIGFPRHKKVLSTANLPIKYAKVTHSSVAEALVAIGAVKAVERVKKVQDPARTADGTGWVTVVDLPVLAEKVCRLRKDLAGALGRDMAMVWPREVKGNANRLEIYIADEMRDAFFQPETPIFKLAPTSYFSDLPIGTNETGDLVTIRLAGQNVFLGAMTRGAKSTMIRQILLAVALFPRGRMRIYNAKGNTFFDGFRDLCDHYVSGRDDESIRLMVEGWQELEREVTKRSEIMSREGLSEVDEKAAAEIEGLEPLIVAMDECHRIINHPVYGAEGQRLMEEVTAQSLSMGITIIYATQRGLTASIPKSITANVRTRWCGMVADQIEVDAILGAGAWGLGNKADKIEPNTGQGYLTGQGKGIQAMRVFNPEDKLVDSFLSGLVAKRGGPVEQINLDPPVSLAPMAAEPDLLKDVMAVRKKGVEKSGEDEYGVWLDDLCGRLMRHHETYRGLEREQLKTMLKLCGVEHRKVKKYCEVLEQDRSLAGYHFEKDIKPALIKQNGGY